MIFNDYGDVCLLLTGTVGCAVCQQWFCFCAQSIQKRTGNPAINTTPDLISSNQASPPSTPAEQSLHFDSHCRQAFNSLQETRAILQLESYYLKELMKRIYQSHMFLEHKTITNKNTPQSKRNY